MEVMMEKERKDTNNGRPQTTQCVATLSHNNATQTMSVKTAAKGGAMPAPSVSEEALARDICSVLTKAASDQLQEDDSFHSMVGTGE